MAKATESQKLSCFFKYMKHPQTKFDADTTTDSNLLGQKSQNLSLGQNLL